MATSLAVPVAYITVLVTALAIFSRVYRKRRAAEKRAYDSWFPSHPARDVYITLLSSETPVPHSMIKSALLVRASADVKRIWRIREDKAALTSLHQRGLLGDETLSRFEAAEKELEAEIVDVVQEADTFRQGWGSMIFQTATEMAQAERTRELVMNIQKVVAQEDKRQARKRKFLPDPVPAPVKAIPSTPARAAIEAQSATPPPPAAVASSSSANGSASGSRSTSPGPEAGLMARPGSSGSTPAGTPSKTTPAKKKKGKK